MQQITVEQTFQILGGFKAENWHDDDRPHSGQLLQEAVLGAFLIGAVIVTFTTLEAVGAAILHGLIFMGMVYEAGRKKLAPETEA